jgi:adenine-specific DNA-methyltransferase
VVVSKTEITTYIKIALLMIEYDKEKFGLEWPGKAACMQIISKHSTATLKPFPDESVNFDTTENLFIEGDNLEVLKLLQKSYFGKIKMIYIDPPYNTGKEFIYQDKYSDSLQAYLEYTGQKDTHGRKFSTNLNNSGRRHSRWLNMMYPRLYLARNLLRDDGVIFISIDDNEQANLKLICNEIFGEENFVANIIWERAYSPINLKKHFSPNHDHVLCYCASISHLAPITDVRSEDADKRYKNPDNDIRGVWQSDNFAVGPSIDSNIYEIITPSGRRVLPPSGTSWRYSRGRLAELIADNRVWFGKDGNGVPRIKRFLSEVKDGITPLTVWRYLEVGHTQDARKETKALFDDRAYFDYPKPVSLLKKMLQLITLNEEHDLILDFFSGSSTTAHAVMELNVADGGNRKYIMVQLPEPCEEKSEAYRAGFNTIADIGKERIRRAASKIQAEKPDYKGDLGFKVFKLDYNEH